MRAAIYLRVSTDEQTTDNQERELRAAAERMGTIVAVYRDAGIFAERAPARSREERGGQEGGGRTISPRAAKISRAIAILVIATTPALTLVSYFTREQ